MAARKSLACNEAASLGLPPAQLVATIWLLRMIVIKQTYVHFRLTLLKQTVVHYANSGWQILPSARNAIESQVVSTTAANMHTSCSYVTNMETCKGTTKSN